MVRFVDASDPTMAGIDRHLGATEQVYIAVANLEDFGGVTADIQQELSNMGISMALKTVQNHLSKLHKDGRITHHGLVYDKWVACRKYPNASQSEGEADNFGFDAF
jgi:hypothetical protein